MSGLVRGEAALVCHEGVDSKPLQGQAQQEAGDSQHFGAPSALRAGWAV